MDGLVFREGIWIHPQDEKKYQVFQQAYLALRTAEHRVYDDEDVKSLPDLRPDRPHAAEWKKRAWTANNFLQWLADRPSNLDILDLGCGNGWFASLMARNHRVTGVDVNLTELQQAARCFGIERTTWCFAGIENLAASTYAVITLNAAVQYFEDLPGLIAVLWDMLEPGGSIHLLDSPFYAREEQPLAKERSRRYFAEMGFPQMAEHYHHHCWDDLKPFQYQLKEKPQERSSGATSGIRSPFG